MKTKTLKLLFLLLSQSIFAQYSASIFPYAGAADIKGEAIAIYYSWDICKIWNLSDGQLLYNDKVNAFGYASKMLKYKIQKSDWKNRDITIKKSRAFDSSNNDSHESIQVQYGGEEFTRFNINVDYEQSGIVYSDVDNKIAIFRVTVEDKTMIYNVPHVSSPDFKSGKKYIAMKKIVERKNVKYPALTDPLISPTGKFAFFITYGLMISLEKNQELWNITQKNGDGYDYNTAAFSADETQIAISDLVNAPNSVYIYSVINGKKINEYTVPKNLSERLEDLKIYPASDMKSYIVDGKIKLEEIRECWLIKADGTSQLLKME
jgi:hypothetical protein